MPWRAIAIVGVALGLAGATACFKSLTLQTSSESSSKSMASSSRSSSGSSSATYEDQVKEATRSWVLGGGSVDAFRRDVSRIAREEGISDWETRQGTYEAIGRGLALARVRGQRLQELEAKLADHDPEHRAWIHAGYEVQSAR